MRHLALPRRRLHAGGHGNDRLQDDGRRADTGHGAGGHHGRGHHDGRVLAQETVHGLRRARRAQEALDGVGGGLGGQEGRHLLLQRHLGLRDGGSSGGGGGRGRRGRYTSLIRVRVPGTPPPGGAVKLLMTHIRLARGELYITLPTEVIRATKLHLHIIGTRRLRPRVALVARVVHPQVAVQTDLLV